MLLFAGTRQLIIIDCLSIQGFKMIFKCSVLS
jgi:hypothetical protein